MELIALRAYLSAQLGAVETFPFGPEILVFKVAGKMFALVDWQSTPLRLSLKAAPQQALLWRELFPAVTPGYHLNKQHWNTVMLDGSLPRSLVLELIDHSYDLVYRSLPKKTRDLLEGQ